MGAKFVRSRMGSKVQKNRYEAISGAALQPGIPRGGWTIGRAVQDTALLHRSFPDDNMADYDSGGEF